MSEFTPERGERGCRPTDRAKTHTSGGLGFTTCVFHLSEQETEDGAAGWFYQHTSEDGNESRPYGPFASFGEADAAAVAARCEALEDFHRASYATMGEPCGESDPLGTWHGSNT